ncbi:MAG: AIPR family protein [Hyphomicrobiales bacterium]
MLEQQLQYEFAKRLLREVDDAALDGDFALAHSKDAALAHVILGYMEEAGIISEHELCPYEDLAGRNRCRITGFALPEDSDRLELYTAQYASALDESLSGEVVSKLAGRAARFFKYAISREFERFAGNDLALAAARFICDQAFRIKEVRIHVLTNARVRDRSVQEVVIDGREVETTVFDIDRLYRASREAITREHIEIDFIKMLGHPLPCLEMIPKPKEYDTYLTLIPGLLIYQLYDHFGARLFEFNVRSFLQSKGKVNRGLRDTLKHEPERFLAYNNGITATADEIIVGMHAGQSSISQIRGLQIVNGAQTTASIHRAKKVDKVDLENVAIAMKLTLVQPDKLSEFVPLIARYSNTQNVIQTADLSANNDFHIQIERLSETVWCPGEEQRWFYERARGAYQVALARYGTTPARRREFEFQCPKSKRFSKTDLAKFLMSWWQRPQVVSRGAQKNFALFMESRLEHFPTDWTPDERFFKDAVSLAILFQAANAATKAAGLKSYVANVVAFLVSKLANAYSDKFDLGSLWEYQAPSEALAAALADWAPKIHAAIITGAGRSNITEWCKRDSSWEHIKGVELEFPIGTPDEILLDEAAEQTASSIASTGDEDDELIRFCCAYSGSEWAQVIAWGAESRRIVTFEQRVAHTVMGYALQGWAKRPSAKQARIGARVLRAAAAAGVITLHTTS